VAAPADAARAVPAKLYLDDDVDSALAGLLRLRGVDAVSSLEAGTVGWPDERHLERAAAQGRALVSYNFHDYLPMAEAWFRAERDHAGIVLSFTQFRRAHLGEALRRTLRLVAAVPGDELRNTVRLLDEFGD
jgi:hypothetical protein